MTTNLKIQKLFRWFLAVLMAITFAATALSTWVLTTTPGLQWLLSTTSTMTSGNVQFEGVSGTFSSIRIQSTHIISEDKRFKFNEFALDWQPSALFSKHLFVSQLSTQAIEILSPPSSDPLTLPEGLDLPLSLSIQRINVASLRIFSKETSEADFVLSNLSAALESDSQQHHLSHLNFDSDYGLFSASARLDGTKPFSLNAQAKLVGLTHIAEKPLSKTSISTTISGDMSQLNLDIQAAGETLNGQGHIVLQPFAALPISALHLSIDEFNPNDFSSVAPSAALLLSIDLQEDYEKQLAGNLLIQNKLAKSLDQGGIPLREIKTQLKLTQELQQFENLSLRLIDDGIISGNLSWDNAQSLGSANLDVVQLNPHALDNRMQAARIMGHIKLTGDTEKQHGIVSLEDETFNLKAQLTHTTKAIALQNINLRRNQSELAGQGEMSFDGQQLFDFRGQLKHFNFADFIQSPESDLNAQLRISGKLDPHPSGSFNFKLENSQFAGHPVTGQGDIEFDNTNHAKTDLAFSIGSNHLRSHGAFGAPKDRMQLDITAPALEQIGYGISGSLHLQAKFGGSITSPSLQLDLTGDNLLLPGEHQLSHINAQGNLQDQAVKFNLQADNYQKSKKTQAEQLTVVIDGIQSNHLIQTQLQVNEDMQVALQASGGLHKTNKTTPTYYWAGTLSKLSATGPHPVNLLAATTLEVGAEHVNLDTTNLSIGGGEATINNTQWTPQQWQSNGRFTGVAVHPGSNTEDSLESLQLGGEWHITAAKQLNGQLHITREKGDWVIPGELPFPLGLEQLQLTAQANNSILSGEIHVQGKHIGKTHANINLPVTLTDSNWAILPSAALDGQIEIHMNDISSIGPLIDDNIESNGRLDIQAKLGGTFGDPQFQGSVQGTDLALALLDQGLQLQQGKLDAQFDHAALHINTFNFTAPFIPFPSDRLLMKVNVPEKPGSLKISGNIGLIGNDTDLKIELDHLPIALQSQHWIVASGSGQAKFSDNTLTLISNIKADAGFLIRPPSNRPQLSNDIAINGQSSQTTQDLSINLDATIDLGKHFYIRAAGLEGRLIGGLLLKTNDKNNLTATGSIATREAKYQAYGQQLTVERGVVNFSGPLDDPGLNILAMRNDVEVKAGVEILGSVRRPAIKLVSTPEVSEAEKLSWIVFGRSLNSGGIDTSLLLSAATSILGGQSSGEGLTQQLSQALGVDEISVRQASDGNPLTSQIGTIGKRISSRAYLSYERGLTTANIGITKLTYELTPKVNVVTQAGLDSAVDVFYIFQFD